MKYSSYNIGYLSRNAKFYGINLGWDFVSEHEWGIKDIQEAFGIRNKLEVYGLEKRLIRELPFRNSLKWWNYVAICQHDDCLLNNEMRMACSSSRSAFGILYNAPDKPPAFTGEICTGWSENSFAIWIRDGSYNSKVMDIYHAILRRDAAIYVGRDDVPFSAHGLNIVIASQAPQELWMALEAEDRATHLLDQEVERTGIRDQLKAKGIGGLKLRPYKTETGQLCFSVKANHFWKELHPEFTLEDGHYGLEELQSRIRNS